MPNLKADLGAYFQWEVRTWSRALLHWQHALGTLGEDRRQALALGERDGGLSLMLADRGFNVVCSDLHGPSEQARSMHTAKGQASKITYERIDALAIPKLDAQFDVVIFKSMIGALGSKEKQRLAILEMHRVLKPGGVLLFAENLQGTAMHRWLRKRFVAWDNYWRYLDPKNDRDLFAPFAQVDLHCTGLFANFGRTEVQRDLVARLDPVLCAFLPKHWRTVWYGVAIKA